MNILGQLQILRPLHLQKLKPQHPLEEARIAALTQVVKLVLMLIVLGVERTKSVHKKVVMLLVGGNVLFFFSSKRIKSAIL